MVNEWEEYLAYTRKPVYAADADGKKKLTPSLFLGRFTFDMLLGFEGFEHLLTILARGYLFHDKDGNVLSGDARERADYAYRALCAWCSIPDTKSAPPRKAGQAPTDYREYHEEFPELVNAKGEGWLYRHVHAVIRFARKHEDIIRKTDLANIEKLSKQFDKAWRKKFTQYQVPLYCAGTEAAWCIRFDCVIADALELGALRNTEPDISPELMAQIEAIVGRRSYAEMVCMMIAYYNANRQSGGEWIVLPQANFDAYFGGTTFSKKCLCSIPENIIERDVSRFGVCRYRVCIHCQDHTTG